MMCLRNLDVPDVGVMCPLPRLTLKKYTYLKSVIWGRSFLWHGENYIPGMGFSPMPAHFPLADGTVQRYSISEGRAKAMSGFISGGEYEETQQHEISVFR